MCLLARPTFTEYFLVMMKPDQGDLESIEKDNKSDTGCLRLSIKSV